MSFPLTQMRDMNVPVARVVVAATQGSIPREIGASMLVTSGDVQGTIGGGALEYEAIAPVKFCKAARIGWIVCRSGQDLANAVAGRLPF